MQPYKATLLALVAPERHRDLLRLVTNVVALVPEMAGNYGEDELDQLVRAFGAVVAESLAGSEREQMHLLAGSAVPALIADGQTTSTLARAVGSLAVVISASLLRDMPPAEQDDAAAWLAGFFGEYTKAIVDEAQRVTEGHGE